MTALAAGGISCCAVLPGRGWFRPSWDLFPDRFLVTVSLNEKGKITHVINDTGDVTLPGTAFVQCGQIPVITGSPQIWAEPSQAAGCARCREVLG
jgi:hypothetical protein